MVTQQQREQLDQQGFLLLAEFSTASLMDELQEQIGDEMLQHMVYAADIDNTNKVSLDDFMRIMRKMKLY